MMNRQRTVATHIFRHAAGASVEGRSSGSGCIESGSRNRSLTVAALLTWLGGKAVYAFLRNINIQTFIWPRLARHAMYAPRAKH